MLDRYYVFFTYTIKGVGGSQLYTLTKANYLKSCNWKVYIVYYQPGELFLKEFCSYSCLYEPNYQKPSFYYLPFKRNRLCKRLLDFLGLLKGEIVFESHSSNMATWAEMTAQRIGNVRHIAYEISETLRPPRVMTNFYEFKYRRHELFGIFDQSINLFLKDTNIQLDYGSPYLSAYGASDCVYDATSPIPLKSILGYVIGIVGRLEKDYIIEYAKSVKTFSENHQDLRITVVFVGGEPKGNNTKQTIVELFQSCANVTTYFTGYIFPIPRELVMRFDICLSGSGSAMAISREGVTTISIDPRDFLANGVMGLTTNDAVFSDVEKKSVIWWLEEIYRSPQKYQLPKSDLSYTFDSHFQCLKQCDPRYDYNLSFNRTDFSIGLLIKQLVNTFLPIRIRARFVALFQ